MSIQDSSVINAMCLNDSDLYLLAGNTYYKNDYPHTIPFHDIQSTNAIAVSGGDVYIVAVSDTLNAAVYFKNDSEINLTRNIANVYSARATGIAISGSDIYVSGYLSVGGCCNTQSVYWKNGVINQLPGGYQAIGIAISGSNVYATGYNDTNQPVYWRNGVVQSLNSSYFGQVTCIAASGDDVYIGGSTNGVDTSVYWKNGVRAVLPGGAVVWGLTAVGNDLYAAGLANPVVAVYWVNGAIHTLGNGGALAIAVGK